MEGRAGRNQVREGGYKSMRHPMYSVFFLFNIAQPLLLYSIPAGIGVALGCRGICRRIESMSPQLFGLRVTRGLSELRQLFVFPNQRHGSIASVDARF
ncbi:MAG: hypothetical protein CMQ44_03205 [Gammaproteobacteria bacterium]|nr:hypothetical protein [Gammaproteobacteria bacterium]